MSSSPDLATMSSSPDLATMSSNPDIAQFSIADYVLFVLMLVVSIVIGIYHGVRGEKTTEEYLLAGRSMHPIPVALSLTATYLSSISILGYIGEVYGHGMQLVWSLLGNGLGIIIATHVFMPVIYPLKLRSINEYLELRFRSVALRKGILVLSTASNLLYLGLCLYAPTIALESVTPINSNTYIVILGLVVTVYSSFGGLKAVVWTDAFQTCVIIFGIVMATVSALYKAGGIGTAWSIAEQHGRADILNTNFGFYERHTIFNTFLKGTITFCAIYSFSQSTVQRMGTLSSYNMIKLVMYLNSFGLTCLLSILFIAGFSIFAVYAGCDPLTLGYVTRKDQMLPYYVMDHLGYLKGIPGLFVACLFSGTLSSISSVLNSLPTMLWVDFLSEIPYFQRASEAKKTMANKLMTVFLGFIMIGLAFVASKLGGLIQAASTILGILAGPTLGVFIIGLTMPIIGKKGAIAGVLTSIIFMTWLGIGAQLHGVKPELLPLSVEKCTNTSDVVGSTTPAPTFVNMYGVNYYNGETPHPMAALYNISYTLFPVIGLILTVVVALIVTLITGKENMEEIDPAYVLPIFRKYVGVKASLQTAEKKPFIDQSSITRLKNPSDDVSVATKQLTNGIGADGGKETILLRLSSSDANRDRDKETYFRDDQ